MEANRSRKHLRQPLNKRAHVRHFQTYFRRHRGCRVLGSHLTDRLLAEGHKVIAIDNLVTGNLANIEHLAGNENYRFVKHNVSNFIFLPEEKLDYIFHFASPCGA